MELTNDNSVIMINMTSFGHPEDQIHGNRLFYTGQEKSDREDARIPLATVLLYRYDTSSVYTAYKIRFLQQRRYRVHPDPFNRAAVNNRPLFEFEILDVLPELELDERYMRYLEPKVYNMVKYGLVCKYRTVGRGILPCETGRVPPLKELVHHFKKNVLIKIAENRLNRLCLEES